MRNFEGQFSDNRPLKRTREEKQKLLRELMETYQTLKGTQSLSKASIVTKIKELQAELAAPPPVRERRPDVTFGTPRPDGPRPPRAPRPDAAQTAEDVFSSPRRRSPRPF